MDAERYRFTVSGHVQGVAFRYTCRDEAERLGLTGWTRNLRDGRVEGEYQGDPENCRQMAAWLKDGPSMARVDHLHVEPSSVRDGETGFDIRLTE